MKKSRNSLTMIQLNDSHVYFDLHQESGRVVRQSIVLREDMPALPKVDVVEGFVPYSSLYIHT